MADNAVLTTLCGICHANKPVYRCPRCGARSCSLACVSKHKSWSGCSGIRDVTAYVPKQRLQTPAGIDHDYNFMRGIELSMERSQRELVEKRGLVSRREIQTAVPRWSGEQLRFVQPDRRTAAQRPAVGVNGRRGIGGAGARQPLAHAAEAEEDLELSHLKRRVRRMCRDQGIDVLNTPKGLKRQRDNATSYNKRTGRLNWQVEWLIYEEGPEWRPTKTLRKALDEVPIHQALAATMEWLVKMHEWQEMQGDDDEDNDGPPRKRRRRGGGGGGGDGGEAPVQSSRSSAWAQPSPYPCQNPFTRAWDLESDTTIKTWAQDAAFEEKKKWQFFLLKPKTNPKQLIPVASSDTLAGILPGRTIEDFPTIYVLLPSARLPDGYVLGSVERQIRKLEKGEESEESPDSPRVQRGIKRGQSDRWHGKVANTDGRNKRPLQNGIIDGILRNGASPTKKRKVAFAAAQDLDDGEIPSGGEEHEGEDDPTSSEGSTSEEETMSESSSSEDEESVTEVDAVQVGLANGTTRKPLVVYDSWSEGE